MKSKLIYCVALIAVILVFSCTGMNSQVKLEKSGIQYWRPQSSNGSVAGKKVAYQLWFDKNKWRVLDHEDSTYKIMEEIAKKQNIHLSHVLNHISNEITAMIQDNRVPNFLEKIYNYNSKKIRYAGGHIINTDIRMVNGNDVLYIKYGATLDSVKWIYLNYFLSNKTGNTRVVAGTTEYLFAEHESEMLKLLNGMLIQIRKSSQQKVITILNQSY